MRHQISTDAPSVDASFLKEMKTISRKLFIQWETGLDRWVIWYHGDDGVDYRIWEVKNEDGSYRPLDNRTLDLLRRADMSKQVKDPAYIASEQYNKRKVYIEEQTAKNRDEVLYRSRQMKTQWKDAVDNASKGIIHNSQLWEKKIFSIPSSSVTLLKKLGRPSMLGRAVKI